MVKDNSITVEHGKPLTFGADGDKGLAMRDDGFGVQVVTIGDHLAAFVEERIAAGRYHSTSEMIRAGLRLLEEQEIRVEALRDALIEGENSGPAEPLDIDGLIAARKKRHRA